MRKQRQNLLLNFITKKMKNNCLYFLLIWGVVLTTGCLHTAKSEIDYSLPTLQPKEQGEVSFSINENKDSLYFHLKYFNLLHEYIIQNGEIDTVDASSSIGKHMYILYHSITYNNLILTVDKSNRIYVRSMGAEQKKIGNILKTDDDLIIIECQDEQGKSEIYNAYNEILKRISAE